MIGPRGNKLAVFGENKDGDVCYRGESVDDIVEDPPGTFTVDDHGGAWCAQDTPDVNHAGIFMPREGNLQPGTSFLQEDAPEIAVDGVKIVSSGLRGEAEFMGQMPTLPCCRRGISPR